MVFPIILVGAKLKLYRKRIDRSMNRARKKAFKEAGREVLKEIRRPMRKRKRRSIPGESPIGKSGGLSRSQKIAVGKTVVWVGATRPQGAHGHFFEHGTESIHGREYAAPALARAQNRIPDKFKHAFY